MRARVISAASAAFLLFSVFLIIALSARPVNDDYWAMSSLHERGFWNSLAWYYLDFQGNVTSWFFILLSQLSWFNGVQSWGALPIAVTTLVLLILAARASLNFLGVRLNSKRTKGIVYILLAAALWLSLESLISPNTTIFFLYSASTIVHAWPWLLFLIGVERIGSGGNARLYLGCLGFITATLGFIDALAIAIVAVILYFFGQPKVERGFMRANALGWAVGFVSGFSFQLIAPSTWQRSLLGASSDSLQTNREAVGRLVNQFPFLGSLFDLLPLDLWSRGLVPLAVVGDLLLRPGLLLLLCFSVLFRNIFECSAEDSYVSKRRALIAASISGGAVYAIAGATYAYAGRHVAGLAILVSVAFLALGFEWRSKIKEAKLLYIAALVISSFLIVNTVSLALTRSSKWDEAQPANFKSVVDGMPGNLIDVPLRSGLSRSGLRDHSGSRDYVDWLVRTKSRS